MVQHIGIDQYGHTYHGLGDHPRKVLMERLGYKSASKMYRDREGKPPRHVGWVIGPYWVTVLQVVPLEADRSQVTALRLASDG